MSLFCVTNCDANYNVNKFRFHQTSLAGQAISDGGEKLCRLDPERLEMRTGFKGSKKLPERQEKTH